MTKPTVCTELRGLCHIVPLCLILASLLRHGVSAFSSFHLSTVPRRAQKPTSTTTVSTTKILQNKPAATAATVGATGTATETSSTVVDDQTVTKKSQLRRVQRKYHTYRWSRRGQQQRQQEPYNINYRVEGPLDGPPVLLVHGFGANLNHFRHQFPVLASEEGGYRVYAIDLLGFGASDKPAEADYSFELFVDLLSDFVQAMDLLLATSGYGGDGDNNNNDDDDDDDDDTAKTSDSTRRWVVGGNSIGGLCSLGVAERLPHLVRGVILLNSAGGMTGFRYEDVPIFVRPLLWFFQNVLLEPKRLGPTFFSQFKTRENIESILRGQGVYRNQTNLDEELLDILLEPAEDEGAETVFLKTFAGPPGPTPESILPNLKCPVLAVWGDNDPWTPVDGGAHPGLAFGNYCDDFQLHRIPNCGHCPHDEHPDEVMKVVLPWLKELDDPTWKVGREK